MRTLVISDLHAPYHHPAALAFLRSVRRLYRTDSVVCIGDLIDGHNWGRWGKATAADSAARELDRAKRSLRPFFSAFPSAHVTTGNHDSRAAKRLEEAGVPAEFARPIGDVLGCPPGWVWSDEHTADGVTYFHGDGYNGAQASRRAASDVRGNAVIGHLHTNAGVDYISTNRGYVWGMSVGCLIDPRSPVFNYGRHHRAKPMIGCGVVIDGVPTFVPMGDV
jgi:metallophosphoesterase superfamily enzyme